MEKSMLLEAFSAAKIHKDKILVDEASTLADKIKAIKYFVTATK